jgi:hypothetical protein
MPSAIQVKLPLDFSTAAPLRVYRSGRGLKLKLREWKI